MHFYWSKNNYMHSLKNNENIKNTIIFLKQIGFWSLTKNTDKILIVG